MRNVVMYSVRGLVYSAGFLALVALPQLLSLAVGAPIAY